MKLRSFLLATTALCVATPACAEPISTAIGLTAVITSIGVSAATAGAIGGAIVVAGISAGINLIANKLLAKPAEAEQSFSSGAEIPRGVQASLAIGANVPRSAIFGVMGTAGHLVYWNVYGPDNRYVQLVYAIGVGPHDGIDHVYFDGVPRSLGSYVPPVGYPVTAYADANGDHAWVRFVNGYATQHSLRGGGPPTWSGRASRMRS
jgi:hypothetical protein